MSADPSQIRRINMAAFTGDAWAQPATLAVPPPGVPLLVAGASALVWQARAMSSGADDAVQVADAAMALDVCAVLVDDEAVARLAVAPGVGPAEALVDDVRPGDRIALAIAAVNNAGTAPWVWLVPIRGMARVAL